MMMIENKFEIGEIVYLKTDTDQIPRIITAIQVHANGCIDYLIICGTNEYWGVDIEISKEKILNPETVGLK
jgi:hypothetical protein